MMNILRKDNWRMIMMPEHGNTQWIEDGRR